MFNPINFTKSIPIKDTFPPCWLKKKGDYCQADLSNTNIFCLGEKAQFRDTLVDTIDNADEVVLASSFLFTDENICDAFLKAYERGVRVYILTASEEALKGLGSEIEDFNTKMSEQHAKLIDALAGKVVLRSSSSFHAKFLVCDPYRGSPRGFISTANFNKALTSSVELGIELKQNQCSALADWFSYVFWKEAEHELLEKGKLSQVGNPPAEPQLPSNNEILITTMKHRSLSETIEKIIESANKEIVLSSFGFDKDHPVTKLLIKKAQEGLKVTVFTRIRPAVSEVAKIFENAGISVVAHEKLHAKALIADDSAMIFTANIQAQGLDTGFEVGVTLNEVQKKVLSNIFKEWKESFPWHYSQTADPQSHSAEICLAEKGLKDGLIKINEKHIIELEDITAKDILEMEKTPPPELKRPGERIFAKEILYKWKVLPPQLPKKAVEVFDHIEKKVTDKKGMESTIKEKVSFSPKVYEHKKKKYVLVNKDTDIEEAKKLTKKFNAKMVIK